MGIFGNPCCFGNCMNPHCEHCPYYKPTLFGYHVPKWLFNLVYKVYAWKMIR